MSTKIYDAYRMKEPKTDLKDIFNALQVIKEDSLKMACKEISENVARLIQHRLDLWTYYGESLFYRTTKKTLLKHRNDRSMMNIIKNGINGHEGTLMLYGYWTYEDILRETKSEWLGKTTILVIPHKNDVFAMTFKNQRFLGDKMFEIFEDYHYQNQSDKPDEISNKAWKKREKDWDEAIGPDYIPANHGLSFDLVDLGDYDLMQMVTNDKENVKAVLEKASEDFDDRIYFIRSTLNCPLLAGVKDYVESAKIMRSEEYAKWAEKKDRMIEKKLGITKTKDESKDME